jgi:hypothetical protein
MVEPKILPIREFIYFDRQKVEDFVSSCEGGLLESKREARTERTPRWKVGFEWKLKAERMSKTKEASLEEISSATPASLFERLHHILEEGQLIQKLDSFDELTWEQLQVGRFVEVRATIEFSAFERLLNLMKYIFDIISESDLPQRQRYDPRITRYIERLLEAQTAYTIRIIPYSAPSKYAFVASIAKGNLRTPKEELTMVETLVFGRIRYKLEAGKKAQIFSLMPGDFPLQLGEEEIDKLLAPFKEKGFPAILGSPPKREDLQVSYPAIVLAPIAIYF